MSLSQAAAVILFCAALPASSRAQALSSDLAAAAPLSADALDQLLRPIALYPDPLLADLFAAATVPAQIVMADRYLAGGGDPNQIADQPWDPSVQALAHYPTVLKWLDDNLPWTTEVGEVFLNQQQEVMASIQHLRLLAQAAGNLQSTPQETIVNDAGTVEIVPANPDWIYVPTYPWNTIYYDRGVSCSFGVSFPVGLWLTHDWDWRNHRVITWGPGHARPANWWRQPPGNRVAPRGVSVWHGPARGSSGAARSADRGFFAPETFRPAPLTAPGALGTVTVNRPTTPTRAAGAAPGGNITFGTRSSFGVAPGGFAVPPMTGRPPPAVIPSTGSRPPFGVNTPGPVSRPPFGVSAPPGASGSGGSTVGSGAFGGSESSFDTRQSSARGAASRGAMSAPPAASSSSARSSGSSSGSSSSSRSAAPSAGSSSSARTSAPSSAPSSRPSQPSQSSGSSRGR